MNIMSMSFNPDKHKIFTPLNKNKYVGNDRIIARSSWEFLFMQWLDSNPNVLQWNSEGTAIPYFDNCRKKNRRYYPDFTVQMKDTTGKISVNIIEIKPAKEVVPPTLRKNKKEKTLLRESLTWQTNIAKFKAAELYCRKRGWVYRILTEKDLFKDGKP